MDGSVRTLGPAAAMLGAGAALAWRRPWLAGSIALAAFILLRPRSATGDRRRRLDARLDNALSETFPASDALSLHQIGRGG